MPAKLELEVLRERGLCMDSDLSPGECSRRYFGAAAQRLIRWARKISQDLMDGKQTSTISNRTNDSPSGSSLSKNIARNLPSACIETKQKGATVSTPPRGKSS